jgi:energy-coupling factor transporter ATP-binding protein EcfA2
MSQFAARALLWRQRTSATRTLFSPLLSPLRRSSSGSPPDDVDVEIAKAQKAAQLAELRSRLRKAEAEADKAKADATAHEAKAKAEADKAKADATAHEAKAKAEADKAKADATAHEAKVKAEATEAANRADKVKAEAIEAANRADKVKAETATETETTRAKRNSRWAWLAASGALVVGAAYLAYDHYLHHNRAVLRRRIREKFLAGPDDDLLPKLPPFPLLPVPPLPAENMTVPLLLLGASGSGKSTQLGMLARDFKKKGVPVIYFRFRAAPEGAPHGPSRDDEPPAPPPDLNIAAQRFYQAVGYPERSSFLSRWKVSGLGLFSSGVQVSATREHVRSRFTEAITDLFVVSGELFKERHADPTIPDDDRVPVVLSDELHDLLHDRNRDVGGAAVFSHFGNEMTVANVDTVMSRTILAASGAELLTELKCQSAAGGDKVSPYMQPDPQESVVRERLAEVGYDRSSVDAIVATCGTRVRLLAPFLKSRLAVISAHLELRNAAAEEYVSALMARCPEKADRRKLVQLLDKLAESPTSTEMLERFPAAAQKPFPNQALLRHVGGKASFQTEAVRQAWIRTRDKYVV